MPGRDDAVRSVSLGSTRRAVVVLALAAAVVAALLVQSWPDDTAEAPLTTTTTMALPTAEAFPALAGQQLLIRSRQDLVVDLGTGVLAVAPPDTPPAQHRSLDEVLASSGDLVAVATCAGADCGIAVDDLATGETLQWLPGIGGIGARAAFSPDGRHLAYYLGEQGDGVTLWRVVVVDLATGERAEAGPIFHDTFVLLDGGRYVVSPLPEGVVVSDTETGVLTALALHVPVEDIETYG